MGIGSRGFSRRWTQICADFLWEGGGAGADGLPREFHSTIFGRGIASSSKNVPSNETERLARREQVAVIGVHFAKAVAARAGEMDRVRCPQENRWLQGVKGLGRFREKRWRDRQPHPKPVSQIGAQLRERNAECAVVNPSLPQVPVEYRGQLDLPHLAAGNRRRSHSQSPHLAPPGFLQVAFRQIRCVKIRHLRSSSKNLPESESMVCRSANPGTSFRSRNDTPDPFSKRASVATGCPRSVITSGSVIPRTHFPVFMCNSRMETETMCSMCHVVCERQETPSVFKRLTTRGDWACGVPGLGILRVQDAAVGGWLVRCRWFCRERGHFSTVEAEVVGRVGVRAWPEVVADEEAS
jgi:hypothetical protein